MADQPVSNSLSTDALLEVLYPILRKLHAQRTISAGKLGILRHLSEQGRATTSELAAAIQVSPQGISLAARELEALRFVERVPDEQDRRKAWMHLTDAGRHQLAQELLTGHDWLDRAVAEQLAPGERTILAAAIPVLRKIGEELPHG